MNHFKGKQFQKDVIIVAVGYKNTAKSCIKFGKRKTDSPSIRGKWTKLISKSKGNQNNELKKEQTQESHQIGFVNFHSLVDKPEEIFTVHFYSELSSIVNFFEKYSSFFVRILDIGANHQDACLYVKIHEMLLN